MELKGDQGWLWMLNTEMLKSEDLCKNIEELIKQEQINQLHNEDKRIWWDNMK